MLEPDQWEDVLSKVTGTLVRGTERVSSNALLNLLETGPDPSTRQKVGKRALNQTWSAAAQFLDQVQIGYVHL